jgi:hypothetical protein
LHKIGPLFRSLRGWPYYYRECGTDKKKAADFLSRMAILYYTTTTSGVAAATIQRRLDCNDVDESTTTLLAFSQQSALVIHTLKMFVTDRVGGPKKTTCYYI